MSHQRNQTRNIGYSLLNGVSIYLGSTLMYTFYNVMSILLKDLAGRFTLWLTRKCLRFYHDPNIGKAVERGRKHAFVMTEDSTISSGENPRLNVFEPDSCRSSRQYEYNITNIAQEHKGRGYSGTNSRLKQPTIQTPKVEETKGHSSIHIGDGDSVYNTARNSLYSLGVDNYLPHSLHRMESRRSIDVTCPPLKKRESKLAITLRNTMSRPKSRIQREAGGMNVIRSALEKETQDKGDDMSDTDDYF